MPVRHVVGSQCRMTNAEYAVMLSALRSMMSVAAAALACCGMHVCALCRSGACCRLAHCMAYVTASDTADFDVHVDKLVAMGFRSREVAPCCSIVSCAAPCCKHLVPGCMSHFEPTEMCSLSEATFLFVLSSAGH